MLSVARRAGAVCALLATLLVSGCGSYPRDPDHTLEHIDRDRVVRVGVSNAPPLTDTSGEAPRGPEIELVTAWAQTRGAQPQWIVGGEEQLMSQLEEGQLDLVVGGLTKKSPWQQKAALTRPWGQATDRVGEEQDYVIATRLGENATISSIERFIDERKAS